ncbi:MAG: terminase small subunit [Rhodoferax sp.]|nr:terminase small subunit [Rhodoferax sp.]
MTTVSTLSTRQARFVQEYLVDGCGAQAAIRAGIAPSGAHVWASRTLRITKVSEALQARQMADATRLSLRREDVLNGLLEAISQARVLSNPMAMIRGWAEIAKMLGMMAPERIKVDVNVAGKVEMGRLNQLSDAELLQIIEAGQAA